jgi:hypothetical protein
MMSKNLISFRAAVSLNNMGVCTMEQGHFGAAMATLKDSLFVMKNILNQPLHERTTTHSLERSLQDKLRAARLRLAQSQAQPLSHHSIEIRPCDEGSVMAMKVPLAQVHYGPPPNVFIPIRLGSSSHQLPGLEEDTDDHDLQQEDIFKIPSAVILYNLGLSHIIMAHIQQNNKTSPSTYPTTSNTTTTAPPQPESQEEGSLLHGGLVCFTMAHGILCQPQARGVGMQHQHHHQHHDSAAVVSFEILQAMLISGLVLYNLFYVFRMNFQVQEAQDVLQSLSSLLYTIQVHEDALRDMNIELENRKTACAA